MPRAPRIEYENAGYHVMARGGRREPIVFDDGDRELFYDTFAEACGGTGWEVFGWVLMDNHCHAAFRTPEPNLVAGMHWFQNAFTRRLSARKHLWGHLFGGRYKAVSVEDAPPPPSIPGRPVGRVQSERSADGRSVAKSKGLKKQIPSISQSADAPAVRPYRGNSRRSRFDEDHAPLST